MPIIHTGQPGSGPPPSGPARETATVIWTAASGEQTILSDWRQGYVLSSGAKGLGMPQYQLYLRESGGIDGDVVTGVRARAREIFLPIVVYGRDRADALRRRALLADAFDPLGVNGGGEGVLTVVETGLEPRRIRAYYTEGMEGGEGRDEAGVTWARFGISLHAAEPYWHGDEVTASWGVPGGEQPFLPVGPPHYLKVRTAQIIQPNMVIDCPGDARSYPRWTIRGPLSTGALFRNRTGQTVSWQLNRALQSGDTVVVDCHPRRRSITLNGTENLWPSLTPNSQLWPLAPGRNVVDMVVNGVADGTSVELAFVPLYKTAYPVTSAATARRGAA
ncbi:MAG TPA: hypothetical protein VHJ17_15570 [Thermomonospora sp.]|nr:hypothetical protein [Thermomonospora sp.]